MGMLNLALKAQDNCCSTGLLNDKGVWACLMQDSPDLISARIKNIVHLAWSRGGHVLEAVMGSLKFLGGHSEPPSQVGVLDGAGVGLQLQLSWPLGLPFCPWGEVCQHHRWHLKGKSTVQPRQGSNDLMVMMA